MRGESGSFSRLKGRSERGRNAENLALEHLLKLGLILVKRNFRAGHKEIDLIMESGMEGRANRKLHIIEVRSLTEPVIMLPFETVDKIKQRAVISAAAKFIYRYNINLDAQFDIVSVIFKTNGQSDIEYFPDAFAPEW